MNSSTIVDSPYPVTATSVVRTFFPFSWVWFSVIALLVTVLAGFRIAEADIWFHLRNAQQLYLNHAFLHSDLYTFTSAGAPLVNFEWLSELPYYFAFKTWDLRGLLAVELALLWLIFAGVYYLALCRGANCVDGALVTMAGVILSAYSFGPRMLHFGWLCLVGLLLVLNRFESAGKGLWILPLIFAGWINLHGSWVFGFVVLSIFIASGLLEGQWKNITAQRWAPSQIKQLLLASAASVLALFVNPYGYRLVSYPFELLYRQRQVQDIAPEWQSVDFHTLWGKLAMLVIFALLTAAWFSSKPWNLSDILLSSFALWAALSHLRFLMFAAIILIPILAPRLQLFPASDAKRNTGWPNLILAAIVVAIIIWSFPSSARLHLAVDTQFPRDAVRFMHENHLKGRLFSAGPYSGFVEFYAPALKTFADGRLDIFVYSGVINDYFKINSVDRPLELLDKYQVGYVLYPANRPLSYVLDRSPAWQAIYEDHLVKLYARASLANSVPQGH